MASRIAVIGTGLAGRIAAYELVERAERLVDPPEVRLCPGPERAPERPHGARREGFLCEPDEGGFDAGAQAARTLLRRLGLESEVVTEAAEGRRWRIFRNGRSRAIPEHPIQFFRKDLLPGGTRWRVLVERFVRAAPRGVDESLEAFAVRRLGRGGSFLADAAATWLCLGDPRRLSVAACLEALHRHERDGSTLWAGWSQRPEGPFAYRPRAVLGSGSSRLVERLDEELGDRVERSARVEAVSDMGMRGFRLHFASGRPLDVDRVIVADHAWNAAELVRQMDAAMAHALDATPHASALRLYCGFRTDALPPRKASAGIVVPRGEGLRTLAVEHSSVRYPTCPDGSTLLTLTLGGSRRPADAELDEAEACEIAARELELMMGVVAEPHFLHIERAPAALPQPELGHPHRLAEIGARLQRHPGFALTAPGGDLERLARVAADVAEATLEELGGGREALAR